MRTPRLEGATGHPHSSGGGEKNSLRELFSRSRESCVEGENFIHEI